jgi:Predicted integral membrane protein
VTTLIGEDQTVLLWAVVLILVAVAITLEQRYKWASTLSSTMLVIIGGFILANIGVIPHSTTVFTSMSTVILVCSIPLLLFKADIKEIVQNSGKLFILFHVAALGTLIGAFFCWFVFGRIAPNADHLLTMYAAAQVGGTVNLVAMANMFGTPDDVVAATGVVGNMSVALLILETRLIGGTKWMRRQLPHPHVDEMEASVDLDALKKEGKTLTGAFWGGKVISLKDIALCLAITFTIVGVSQTFANWVLSLNPPEIMKQLFGSQYLILSILTVAIATIFKKQMSKINGSMELGNIGILAWFATIGISGNLMVIIQTGIWALVFHQIISLINMTVTFFGAKLLKCNWEDVAIANQATVGGPTTAAPMAVAFGWNKMVVPGLLVGLWGYVIGSYFGILFANVIGMTSVL